MGLLGGLTSSFINPMNLAMLADRPCRLGGARTKTLMSAIGQQIIQQLGQQLGLPQSTIDLAQGAFAVRWAIRAVPREISTAVQNWVKGCSTPARSTSATRSANSRTSSAAWPRASPKARRPRSQGLGRRRELDHGARRSARQEARQEGRRGRQARRRHQRQEAVDHDQVWRRFAGIQRSHERREHAIKTLGEAVGSMSRKQPATFWRRNVSAARPVGRAAFFLSCACP